MRDEETWNSYADSQRRYNSQFDEWDLCSDFAPDDLAPDPDLDTDDDFCDNYSMESAEDHTFLDRVGDKLVVADMDKMFPAVQAPVMDALTPLMDVAYEIFGFSDLSVSGQSGSVTLDWAVVTKCLGLHSHGDISVSPAQQDVLCAYFTSILNAASLSGISPELSDLRQDTADLASTEWVEELSVSQAAPQQYVIGSGIPTITINPIATAYIGRIYQHLEHRSIEEIIFALTRRGFAVTLGFGAKLSQSLPIPHVRPCGLGYRPPDYEPNKWDYYSYVHLRDSFLQSPRGCAALLHGGLVGRMAREVVSVEILYAALADPKPDSAYFEPLTDREIDLLCGTYDLDTGITILCGCYSVFIRSFFPTGRAAANGTPQYARVSWWPRPSAWEKSALGNICWTADAEYWYTRRHGKLLSGEFPSNTLLINSKWRNSLRFTHTVRKVGESIIARTSSYLDQRVPRHT
ncbi:hypothetical protein ONZ45_g6696 [Pleurotus djamor]|nr:hypothetical protein ONZ45_g6696 [Pleurotus djamor]